MRSTPFLLKIKDTLFYISIFLLPTQLGKHFWISESYVQGVRVDYLSPTFYLFDVFVVALFSLYFFEKRRGRISRKLVAVCMLLFLSVIFAERKIIAAYMFLRVLEAIWYTGLVASLVSRRNITIIVRVVCLTVLFQSIVAGIQYAQQASIGGLLYWLGERLITADTPGAAVASIDGHLLLRPYGTFSHPNILAGFLVLCLTFVTEVFFHTRKKKPQDKWLYIAAATSGTAMLFCTLSRIAVLVWSLYAVVKAYKFLEQKKDFLKNVYSLIPVVLMVAGFLYSPLFTRFTQMSLRDESVAVRLLLQNSARQMIVDHLVFGVGPLNFISSLKHYLPHLYFALRQPVHNIFLLVLAETGIVGFFPFAIFLWMTIKKMFISKSLFMALIVEMIILGMFDHYLITSQQGIFLSAFIFGLSLSRVKNDTIAA